MGDPLIVHKNSRKNVFHRKLQSKFYNFLERPSSKPEICYHVALFFIVFVCLALSVFSTIDSHEKEAGEVLYHLEIFIVVWFSVEFLVRLWAAGCRSRFQGLLGRLKFIKSPFCVIDVITISASIIVLSGFGGQVYATSALRGLRFFQILRLVRVDRKGGTWKLLGSVVYAHRQELLTTLYIDFLILVFSSFTMYLVEKDVVDTKFDSYAHALWWGVITLCTVGYGDITPHSWQGKMVASFSSIAGIAFFALPAGILGSGFALKVQEQQRQKHMIRRRVPAANLIQCLWRCYAVSEGHDSAATWRIHMVPPKSPPAFKNNTSFVHRLSIRRTRQSMRSPVMDHFRSKIKQENSDPFLEDGLYSRKSSIWEEDEDSTTNSSPTVLNHKHKGAIRAIRKLKYLVAKRKFKEALKPYDIKDVIESYSAGHSDLMTKVKSVQSRLDVILGKPGSKAKDTYDSKLSLASRIVNVERQVDTIEEKLQNFLDMYMEDRQKLLAIAVSTETLVAVEGSSDNVTVGKAKPSHGKPDKSVLRSSTVATIPTSILQQGNLNSATNGSTSNCKSVTYSTQELNKKPLKATNSLKSIMVKHKPAFPSAFNNHRAADGGVAGDYPVSAPCISNPPNFPIISKDVSDSTSSSLQTDNLNITASVTRENSSDEGDNSHPILTTESIADRVGRVLHPLQARWTSNHTVETNLDTFVTEDLV